MCRLRCEDNIKTRLKIADTYVLNWIELLQDRDYWKGVINLIYELSNLKNPQI